MKLSYKQMLAEFREFAFKGNMLELAVAVVLGAAFSGVVNSLVKDIIMPSISYVTSAAASAGHMAKGAAEHVASSTGMTSTAPATAPSTSQAAAAAAPPPPPPASPPPAAAPANDPAKPVDFSWRIGRIEIGHFIAELLNFVLVAFAVFLMVVKLLGSVMKRVNRQKPTSGPTTKECPKCLSLIPIMATKCAHCTADLPAPEVPAAPATT